jgi:hypothetical protein
LGVGTRIDDARRALLAHPAGKQCSKHDSRDGKVTEKVVALLHADMLGVVRLAEGQTACALSKERFSDILLAFAQWLCHTI